MQLQQRLLHPPTIALDSKPSVTEPPSQSTRPTRSMTLPAISQLTTEHESIPEIPQPVATDAPNQPTPAFAPDQPAPAPPAPPPDELTNESIAAHDFGRTASGLSVPFTPSSSVPANGGADPATSYKTVGSSHQSLVSSSDKATGTSIKATDFSVKATDFEAKANVLVAGKGKGKLEVQDATPTTSASTFTSVEGPRTCPLETFSFQQNEPNPEHSAPPADLPVNPATPAPAPTQSSEPTPRKSSVSFATLPASARPTTEAPRTNGSHPLDMPKARSTAAQQPNRSHSRSTTSGAIPDQRHVLSPLKDNRDNRPKAARRFSLLPRGLTKRSSSNNETSHAGPANSASSKWTSLPSVMSTRPTSQSGPLHPPNDPEESKKGFRYRSRGKTVSFLSNRRTENENENENKVKSMPIAANKRNNSTSWAPPPRAPSTFAAAGIPYSSTLPPSPASSPPATTVVNSTVPTPTAPTVPTTPPMPKSGSKGSTGSSPNRVMSWIRGRNYQHSTSSDGSKPTEDPTAPLANPWDMSPAGKTKDVRRRTDSTLSSALGRNHSAGYVPRAFTDEVLSYHEGATDKSAVTVVLPPEMMARIRMALTNMGIEFRSVGPGGFKLECLRPKRYSSPGRSAWTALRKTISRSDSTSSFKAIPTSSNSTTPNSQTQVDNGQEVRFSVEITQLRDFPGLYSVDIRRMSGNVWAYKSCYTALLDRCKPQETGEVTKVGKATDAPATRPKAMVVPAEHR